MGRVVSHLTMGIRKYIELQEVLTQYIAEKKLRKTEERYMIFKFICFFPGHFDVCQLHQKLEEANFHVSRATLYNTIEVLLACGLIVRHQLTMQSVQYELRVLADTHTHLICTQCGNIREQKLNKNKNEWLSDKLSRFTPTYQMLYIYGLCSKCSYRLRLKKNK